MRASQVIVCCSDSDSPSDSVLHLVTEGERRWNGMRGMPLRQEHDFGCRFKEVMIVKEMRSAERGTRERERCEGRARDGGANMDT